jgi:CRP-like cAMP-binding protein
MCEGERLRVEPRTLVSSITPNRFLASLSERTQARLFALLEPVTLEKGTVLAPPGTEVTHVYFPAGSVISTVTLMADGDGVEVGFAGREGFSPMAVAFGSRSLPHATIVQISGPAYRMSADAFLAETSVNEELRRYVFAFAEYSFIAATQFAACNRLHSIEERYARWLLMADDRVSRDDFVLTQEFTAQMLGVRRASVTVVAGAFSAAGLIAYRRSVIRVLDHDGLQQLSCECYRVINSELDRVLGYNAREPAAARS